MRRMHIHTLGRVHAHRPDWHAVGIHLGHVIHDPRFWAAVALAVLLGAMILAVILSKFGDSGMPMRPVYPTYPYMP